MLRSFANAATETACSGIFMDLDDLSFGRTGAPVHDLSVKLVEWNEGELILSLLSSF